jgi:hypothetical protein
MRFWWTRHTVGVHGPAAAGALGGVAADEGPAAAPVDCEIVVDQNHGRRTVFGLLHVGVPGQLVRPQGGVVVEVESGKGPLNVPGCAPSAAGATNRVISARFVRF